MFEHRGKIVMCDIIDFHCNEQDGYMIHEMMKDTIKEKCPTMRIVGENLRIFCSENNEEEGFTSVLLLDSSHFSCHCYSKEGMISVDLFTCGQSDTFRAILDFLERIKTICSTYTIVKLKEEQRFPNAIIPED